MSFTVPVPVSRARSAIASSSRGAALPNLLVVFGALALAGCAADSSVNKYVPNIITPYRMDIQQGNFVTQDMVDKLQAGQTRDQVRFILGTPLLTDAFHAQRWDYIFRSSKGWNDPEKHHLTVFFGSDEKLAKWDSDVPPPKSMTPVAENKGFFGGLFGKSDDSKTTPASASATPAGAVSPAAAPAPQGAGSNAAAAQPNPAVALSNTPAEKPEEKKEPSTLRRLFGWMPFVSTEDAAAGAARAASPDNTPMPRPSIAQPPRPPEPAEPPPPAGTGVMSPASAAAVSVPEQATPAPAPAPVPAPAAVPAPAPIVVPAPSPPAPVTSPPAAVVAAAPVVTPAPSATTAPAAPQPVLTPEGVLSAIERWRAAWQAKDVNAYLAAYAPDFRPANNLSRTKWEAQRRERLSKPTFIVVKVVSPQVTLGKDDAAIAVFVQEYESNLLKESGRKTLKMARYGNDWLIVEEISK